MNRAPQTPLLVALALATGIGIGWLGRGPGEPRPARTEELPYILTGDFHVQKLQHRGTPAKVCSLRPYRVSVDWKLTELRPAPDQDHAQLWAISFDGGRTWVYAEEVE